MGPHSRVLSGFCGKLGAGMAQPAQVEPEPQPWAGLAPVTLPLEALTVPFYRRETKARGREP